MPGKFYFRGPTMLYCLSGAHRPGGVYGVTAGEAQRARPGRHDAGGGLGFVPPSALCRCSGYYPDDALDDPYRDDFRSRGRSTQQTEELGSAVLHGTPADVDPTVERAVVDPIGRLGRVALPPVCDADGGLDVMPPSALVPHSQEGHR